MGRVTVIKKLEKKNRSFMFERRAVKKIMTNVTTGFSVSYRSTMNSAKDEMNDMEEDCDQNEDKKSK